MSCYFVVRKFALENWQQEENGTQGAQIKVYTEV